MRILVESPSCNSRAGSNGGVGFGWISHLAPRVDLHVVAYEPIITGSDIPDGVTVHAIPRSKGARLGSMIDYHTSLRRHRERIFRTVQPDVVHSVEPGGWIGPRGLATRRFPYVLGPLNGGGARAPRSLSMEVMAALPVHPVANLLRGSVRSVGVNLLNEAIFGSDLPTARWLGRAAMRRASRIVLATSLDRHAVPRSVADRVERIPLVGLDLDRFSPRPRARGDLLEVLYVGRITPWKGLHLLVEALAGTRATLTVVGPSVEDWYERHCREVVDRLGLSERVRFLGSLQRDDLVDAYAAADVMAMPSLWEPYGMTYIEAMACGTPVIGLATGGAPEVIVEGAGWLVAPTDRAGVIRSLGERLQSLEQNRDVAREAGEAARAHAVATWNWDTLVERMLAVYERA